MRRLLENVIGSAKLQGKDPSQSIEVGCSVRVYQDERGAGPGRATVDGLKSTEVELRCEDVLALAEWVGKAATLLLEDGRRLHGFVSSARGTFTARGGLSSAVQE
jgi:hypothetical protein